MKTNVARILLTAALVTGLSIPVASAASARTASAAAGMGQGPLLAWGDNSLGELGIGSMQNQYSPVAVNMPFGLRATQARSGPFSIAVNSAGQVFAWGRGEQGELGNGAFKSRQRPVRVRLPKGVKVTAARVGFDFAVALTSTGKVLTWGDGSAGELGNGHRANHDAPVWVRLPRGVRITAVSACGNCAVALTSTGRVLAWGDNSSGQLGNGKKAGSTTPVWVALRRHTKVTAIAAGVSHLFGVTSTGALLAWGSDAAGDLGTGRPGLSRVPVPVRLPRGVKVMSASAGLLHSLALTTTGRVLAWGDNEAGQLGTGNMQSSDVPVWVHLPKAAHIVSIAAGRYHCLALTRGGKVLTWGLGGSGQLGTGTLDNHLLPVQISVRGTVIAIGAGDEAESSMAVVKKLID